MKTLPIDLPQTEINQFCQHYNICKLSLFGSVLRDDFTIGSDIDVLVEFEPGKTPGLAIIRMEDELSHLLGRVVDLRTPADLSRYFRDRVLQEAMVIYEQS
ncbi:MAG: nucleotidyltransferase family protein [Cyanobacteria bacterium J06592_8]